MEFKLFKTGRNDYWWTSGSSNDVFHRGAVLSHRCWSFTDAVTTVCRKAHFDPLYGFYSVLGHHSPSSTVPCLLFSINARLTHGIILYHIWLYFQSCR